MKHFIDLSDYSPECISEIISSALSIKSAPLEYADSLQGKKLGLYFQKPSMRTKVSFEVGIHELGAQPIVLQHNEIQIGSRESVSDVAEVLSRYLDGIVMRVFKHTDIVEFSEHASIPVINGLSDFSHPCQAIADAMTIVEKKGSGRHRVVFMGDGNNVCNSLIKACAFMGFEMIVSCPRGYEPAISSREAEYSLVPDPFEAALGADVLYTDVWTSMGQEEQQFVRRSIFEKYRVTSLLMQQARKDCIFMHCLPAHRGEEVDAAVIDSDNSVVFDQAENRLHAQKAILKYLFS
jgi:ornithine carbamoyltransferase